MTKIPDTDPIFPDNFRVIPTGMEHSFWAWAPDLDRQFPCLTIDCGGLASDALQHGGVACVSWEFGPELESGPFRDHTPVAQGLAAVQQAIADVMREVREEYEVASRYVDPDILREDQDERRSLDDD